MGGGGGTTWLETNGAGSSTTRGALPAPRHMGGRHLRTSRELAPPLHEVWCVLLPTPVHVEAISGRLAGLSHLPARHNDHTAYAEVRRLVGAFKEGAAAEIQAAG